MRIAAGSFKGQVLKTPKGMDTRPSSARLRESLFNILIHSYTHQPVYVADFFAGSGALGFEGLSNGAKAVLFFEKERAAIDCIRANADKLKVSSRAHIVKEARLDKWSSILAKQSANWAQSAFDTAFSDAPYNKGLSAKLAGVMDQSLASFAPGALWVAELASSEANPEPRCWRLVERRDYSTASLCFFKKT